MAKIWIVTGAHRHGPRPSAAQARLSPITLSMSAPWRPPVGSMGMSIAVADMTEVTGLTPNRSHPPAVGIRTRFRHAAIAAVAVVTAAASIGYVVSDSIASIKRQDGRLLLLSRVGAAQLSDVPPEELTQDQVAATQSAFGGDVGMGATLFRRWATSVLNEPDVIGAGAWSADGDALCFAGSPLEGSIAGLRDRMIANGTSDQLTVRVAVSAVDRGPGAKPAMYMAIWSTGDNIVLGSPARSAPVLAVFAIIGCVVTTVLLRRFDRYLSPLTLLHNASGDCADHATLDALARRGDVVGGLADRMIERIVSVEEALHRAHRAEQTAQDSVQQNTRTLTAQMKKLKTEASRDALTGLANRRFIEERLTEVYDDYSRGGQQVVIVMIDVDNFKPLNDNEGHAAGDDVLRFLGELLRGSIRDTDIAARYGGDEFVLLLADADCDQAGIVVSRIMRMFGQRMAVMPIKTSVTLSVGMACSADYAGIEVHDLLRKADDALYLSKRSGKNLIKAAE